MMKSEKFAIANIYVPVKRRATLDPKKVQELAESILKSACRPRSWCERTANASC